MPSRLLRIACSLQRWLLMLFWAVSITSGSAYAASYTFRSETFNWETSSNPLNWDRSCTSYPGDDDQASIALTGGFAFPFDGVSYNTVRVLSNGMLQFGTATGFHRNYTNTTLPAASGPGYSSCANAAPGPTL
ncbi:MAG: LamG domain-containing protein, partial [Ideonella sp.]